MMDGGYNRAAIAAGAFFVVVGTAFLLEELGVFEVNVGYVLPVLLILLGLGVLLTGRRRQPARWPSREADQERLTAWPEEERPDIEETRPLEDQRTEPVWTQERVTEEPAESIETDASTPQEGQEDQERPGV
jgi:hypothetical protein